MKDFFLTYKQIGVIFLKPLTLSGRRSLSAGAATGRRLLPVCAGWCEIFFKSAFFQNL